MRKPRYTLKIDGKVAYTGNHIPALKERADFEFEYLNAYHAEILVGKKPYCYRFYDGKWSR